MVYGPCRWMLAVVVGLVLAFSNWTECAAAKKRRNAQDRLGSGHYRS